ncbi:MAG: prepilin-type N-terminal cleavage/methylation domain-containing protein [Bacteroidales bacterium]|nr:prepilin-type N-terminal cleavage/methylation domain-containing protein [Bacteroidales bacterium]
MKSKSFTLIELLVVIVIIGVLAGVITISTSSSIDKANFAKAQVFSSTVQNSMFESLFSEWNFDEISDVYINTSLSAGFTVKDDLNLNNGNAYGGVILRDETQCLKNKCLDFDGVNDYVTMVNNNYPTNANALTLTGWIKPRVDESEWGGQVIFGKPWVDHTGLMYYGRNIRFGFYSQAGSLYYFTHTKKISLNEWHYIVGSVKNSTVKIFVDGELQTFNNTDTVRNNTSYPLIIGATASGYYWFDGLIDEVKFYNELISESQVKKNYLLGLDYLLNYGSISKEDYNQRINELAYEK